MEPVEELKNESSTKTIITSIAVYYVCMAISSIIINVTDWTFYNSNGYRMVMQFAFFMIIIWSIVFYSARFGVYKYKLLELALGFWLVFIICWMYIVILNLKDDLGFYCVGRRCPNSFWIVVSKLNKLPIDNALDFYYHHPHLSPDDVQYMEMDEIITKTASFRSRLDWLSIDFSNYLLQSTVFITLCMIFVASWFYLKYSLRELKIQSLCSECRIVMVSTDSLKVLSD